MWALVGAPYYGDIRQSKSFDIGVSKSRQVKFESINFLNFKKDSFGFKSN